MLWLDMKNIAIEINGLMKKKLTPVQKQWVIYA